MAVAASIEIGEVTRPEDVVGLTELVEACAGADGHSPLGEHSLLAAVRPGSAGHSGFTATRHGVLLGYAHLSELHSGEGWSIELAVHPEHRTQGAGTALFETAVEHACSHGGGAVNLWVYGDSAAARSLARHFGLSPARELLQLRLPELPEEAPAPPAGIEMSTFDPEVDAREWLAVNNRAFAWHPENGGWTRDDLRARMQTDWFDPHGFLVARARDGSIGAMAGFCWTKLHHRRLGEIYVVGVDPDHQGRGLGRFLTIAGLASLRERGAKEGMLYVEADNTRARRLYLALGFVHDHTDTCWRREICP